MLRLHTFEFADKNHVSSFRRRSFSGNLFGMAGVYFNRELLEDEGCDPGCGSLLVIILNSLRGEILIH